jgi:hypothetical protein
MEKNKLTNNFLNLEEYFDNLRENISVNFYKRASDFGFDNEELFKSAVNLIMLANGISFYKEEKQRYYQKKFSDIIYKKYNKCIITNKGTNLEFEACHIVPVNEGGDYTESNGLLLSRNLHILYDNYLWSINPETLCVDVLSNDEEIVGTIIDYSRKKVNLNPDYFMKINLKSHWNKFLEKKRLFCNK